MIPAFQTASQSACGRSYGPPYDPSPSSSRTRSGDAVRSAPASAIGFRSAGGEALSSRVHGKFSSHDAWLASGSIDWTTVQVRGPFHQLWKTTWESGRSAMNSGARPAAGELPPWPFTSRNRRKPWPWSESSRSRTTATYVPTRRLGLPG